MNELENVNREPEQTEEPVLPALLEEETVTAEAAPLLESAAAEQKAEPVRTRVRAPITHSTAAKAIAFILFVLMTLTAALSAVGAVLMVEMELYTMPEEEFRREVFSTIARDDAYRVAITLIEKGEEAALEELSNSNLAGVRVVRRGLSVNTWLGGIITGTDENRIFTYQYYWYQNGLREWWLFDETIPESAVEVTTTLYLTNNLLVQDEYRAADLLVTLAYDLLYWVYAIFAAAVILMIACFVFLMVASGRRRGQEGITSGWGTKIPFDLLTAIVGTAGIGVIALAVDTTVSADPLVWLLLKVPAALGLPTLLLGWCMSFALRLKLGGWWRNTLVFYVLRLLWKFLCTIPKFLRRAVPWLWNGFVRVVKFFWKCFRKLLHFVGLIFKTLWRGVRYMGRWMANLLHAIPLVWKTALIFVGISFIDLLFLTWKPFYHSITITGYDMIWIFGRILLFMAVTFGAFMLKKLQQGGEKLAEGDLSYQVDTKEMFWDFKRHGENLNRIGEGMTAAVEHRMKSERMKTELITNVSHDIKTPLTSIINYADLIGKEPCDNEKITEYAEVLHRQSERLKRLIEDLVEASKASTGNLEIFLAPCEAGVLLTQAAGEYEQRLKDGRLELITRQPEHPVKIMADGRRLWRVIDNLMNNICKYAQSGTRVYLTLEEKNGNAVLSFKNTSRDPLGVPAEELMERFVQGDSARSTEGNGLGLSIARSLTELQNGKMTLTVDGDLFKVELAFPLLN